MIKLSLNLLTIYMNSGHHSLVNNQIRWFPQSLGLFSTHADLQTL